MAKSSNSSSVSIAILIFLGILSFGVQHWYIVVPVIALLVIGLVHSSAKREQARIRGVHQVEVLKLAEQLKKDLDYANNGKSVRTRESNCDDALALLDKLDMMDGSSNLITNKKELREKLTTLKRILPVTQLFEKLEKLQYTGETSKELKVLREILYHIECEKICDADLESLQPNRITGEVPTLVSLRNRLNELGQMAKVTSVA